MPKLILSRKGFDSGSGGKANVLLADQLISFPIPQQGTGIRYDRLRVSPDLSYRHLMNDLGIAPFEEAHLDPDLISSVLPGRPDHWLPAFGQQGAALSHLYGEQVGVGDMFLFFGWFRQIEKDPSGQYRYCKNCPDLHIIYGYLEVGEVIDLSTMEAPAWAKYHPHWVLRKQMNPRNALFIAAERSSMWPGKAGAGVFPFSPELILTSQYDDNKKRSQWALSACFFHEDRSCLLSYHRHKMGQEISTSNHLLLSSAYRGQEFVCEQDAAMQNWIRSLMVKSQD